MKLSAAGEDRFIRHVQRDVGGPGGRVLLGIGDDAAVIACPDGHSLVLTCDAAVAGRHFRREWFAPEAIGARAVAASISDVAAMGATPAAILLTLAISPDEDLATAREIVKGAAAMAEQLGARLAGGETVSTNGPLTLDVTASGFVPTGRELRRSAAELGDVLLVSGTLGESAAGVQALTRGLTAGPAADRVIARYRRPQPRVTLGPLLTEMDGVRCAIDVSDGLARDAGHIAKESAVAIRIDAQSVPQSQELRDVAATLSADPLTWALAGGEDFELLFTAKPGAVDDVIARSRDELSIEVSPIGEVVQGEGVTVIAGDGSAVESAQTGWDHFSGD